MGKRRHPPTEPQKTVEEGTVWRQPPVGLPKIRSRRWYKRHAKKEVLNGVEISEGVIRLDPRALR